MCESHERARVLLKTAKVQVETALQARTERARDAAVRRLLRTVLKCARGRSAKQLGEAIAECAVEGDAGDNPVIHLDANRLYLRGVFDVEELGRRIVW